MFGIHRKKANFLFILYNAQAFSNAKVICILLCIAGYGAGQQKCKPGRIPAKKIDSAYLTVNKQDINTTVIVQLVTEECYKCDLQNETYITPEQDNCTVRVDTRWKMRVQLLSNDIDSYIPQCSEDKLSQHFKNGGNYTLTIKMDGGQWMCTKIEILNSPQDNNIPIYVALASFVVAAVLWVAIMKFSRSQMIHAIKLKFTNGSPHFIDPDMQEKSPIQKRIDEPSPIRSSYNLWKRKGKKTTKQELENTYTEQDLGNPNLVNDTTERKPKRERLKSLDTVRGISIVLMIFVNYRGGDYWFFKHSKWNGLTVADLVFPWFVWIMGTAMVYSFQSLLRSATPKKLIFWKIFKRSCILFLLGLLINCDGIAAPKLRELRIPGVLQRFAGTYLIIATMHMFFAKPTDPNQYTWWSGVRDIVDYWGEWVFNIIIVLVWFLLTFVLPVPGCPTGYLGPGGLEDGGKHMNCTGGAASYIDRKIFGAAHIYQTPTCKEIYETTVPHDPEGLLGTLMSCLICFLGLQAGKILQTYPDWKARVRRFLVWAFVLGILALALCNAKRNGGLIPINKNLWSFTFVLSLSSMAFILLSFCYMTIDVYKIWSGAPFYYPGMNSIFFYVCHIVFQPYFPVSIYVDPTSHWELLALHIWGPCLWCTITYVMHKKKMYFSI